LFKKNFFKKKEEKIKLEILEKNSKFYCCWYIEKKRNKKRDEEIERER